MAREDQFVDLLLRYEDAVAAGTPRTPEQLCRECPELIPEFRRVLAGVGKLQAVMDGQGAESGDPTPAVGPGRFRPLSFHARGGLGAVFVAEDTELGRPVALKTMQKLPAADPAARRRFLLEAEVTGRLDHPGVVPVYGVGRDANGRPYYAMRFVRGNTLGEAVKQLHARPAADPDRAVEFRRLLARFVAVCQTVAHAHERGVVHRDLKPANILLGPFGETLVVDWGLAKILNAPPAGDAETVDDFAAPITSSHDGVSVAGQVKGSPAYMSPEQARGEATVGTAADVYGLGAVLFALLAGRAPYVGPTAEVVDRVRKATAPPSARDVVPAVPRPLDAICRKAMASRPEDRYPSAQAVAADVERFLADEPVTAYRDPFPERARRWVRRHRVLVAAAAVGLVVGSALLAAAGVVLTGKNRQLASANRDLDDRNHKLEIANEQEHKARTEAETHLRRNLAQLNGVLRFFLSPGQAAALRRDEAFVPLLDNMEGYFAAFAKDAPDNPDVRQALLLVRFLRVANDAARGLPEPLARRLQALRAELDAGSAGRPPTAFETWARASVHNELARRLIEARRFDEARPEIDAAYRVLDDVKTANTDACRVARAVTCMLDVEAAKATDGTGRADLLKRLDEAIVEIRLVGKGAALDVLGWLMAAEHVAPAGTPPPRDPVGKAVAFGNLYLARGEIRTARGNPAGALTDFTDGYLTVEDVPPADAGNPVLVELAAVLRLRAAEAEFRAGKFPQAWKLVREAEARFGPLVRLNPKAVDRPELLAELELGVVRVGLRHLAALDPKDAAARETAAAVVRESLAALDRWQAGAAGGRDFFLLRDMAQARADLAAQAGRFQVRVP